VKEEILTAAAITLREHVVDENAYEYFLVIKCCISLYGLHDAEFPVGYRLNKEVKISIPVKTHTHANTTVNTA
jgi:hypothetical protein